MIQKGGIVPTNKICSMKVIYCFSFCFDDIKSCWWFLVIILFFLTSILTVTWFDQHQYKQNPERYEWIISTDHNKMQWNWNGFHNYTNILQQHLYGISLTHWGRVMHLCVDDLIINGTDNGLAPGQHQAIIRTSAGILLIVPLRTNFSEISIGILTFSVNKMRLKVPSAK